MSESILGQLAEIVCALLSSAANMQEHKLATVSVAKCTQRCVVHVQIATSSIGCVTSRLPAQEQTQGGSVIWKQGQEERSTHTLETKPPTTRLTAAGMRKSISGVKGHQHAEDLRSTKRHCLTCRSPQKKPVCTGLQHSHSGVRRLGTQLSRCACMPRAKQSRWAMVACRLDVSPNVKCDTCARCTRLCEAWEEAAQRVPGLLS